MAGVRRPASGNGVHLPSETKVAELAALRASRWGTSSDVPAAITRVLADASPEPSWSLHAAALPPKPKCEPEKPRDMEQAWGASAGVVIR